MKMATLNISLPGPMNDYVRARCRRDYGNVSEFFRALLREEMQSEIAADLAFLESTSSGAQPGPTKKEIAGVLALQKRVRKKARGARRL
jgi:Arc/MetJ-type ribon-helix-helix transcriptional regulator